MSIYEYKDPIISKVHTSGEHRVSVRRTNESYIVVSGMFALTELPDIQYKVKIEGYYEVGEKDKIISPNQFKVDYTNGYVYMHPSKDGQGIIVSEYYGRGVSYYPASRVYLGIDDAGEIDKTLDNMLDIIASIDSMVEEGNSLKDALSNAIATGDIYNIRDIMQSLRIELEDYKLDFNTVVADLHNAISTANQANADAGNMINDLNNRWYTLTSSQ